MPNSNYSKLQEHTNSYSKLQKLTSPHKKEPQRKSVSFQDTLEVSRILGQL